MDYSKADGWQLKGSAVAIPGADMDMILCRDE